MKIRTFRHVKMRSNCAPYLVSSETWPSFAGEPVLRRPRRCRRNVAASVRGRAPDPASVPISARVARACGSKIFRNRIQEGDRALSRAVPDIHRDFARPTTSSVEIGAGTPLVDVKATPASCCTDQLLTTARFIRWVYRLMCMRTARAAPPGKVEAALMGSPHALGSSVTSLRAASCGSNGGSNAIHRLTTPAQQALHRDQPDSSGSRPKAEPLRHGLDRRLRVGLNACCWCVCLRNGLRNRLHKRLHVIIAGPAAVLFCARSGAPRVGTISCAMARDGAVAPRR